MEQRRLFTKLISCLLALLWISSVSAQTNMERAEEMIEEERVSPRGELNFVDFGLETLPDSLWELTELESLILNGNQLSSFPDEITHLSKLETLIVSRNNFTEFPMVLTQMPSLRQIHLRENQIANIPPEISNLVNLFSLDLQTNQITDVPVEITELAYLVIPGRLRLHENPLRAGLAEAYAEGGTYGLFVYLNPAIADDPRRLANYQEARLAINGMLWDIEEGENFVRSDLILINKDLTILPPELWQLSHLERLTLDMNQLSNLSSEISQLTNLRYLEMRENGLTEFPETLLGLPNLEVLVLSENNISSLRDLSPMTGLRELYLDHNQLTSIGDEISGLRSLERLELEYNQLSSFTADLSELQSLTILDLSYNQFTSVPAALATSPTLLTACPTFWDCQMIDNMEGTLTLEGNPVGWPPPEYADVPLPLLIPTIFGAVEPSIAATVESYNPAEEEYADDIEKVRNGASSQLRMDFLGAFPEGVFELTSLTSLSIHDSYITALPPEIGQLSNLQRLVIEDTPLTALPLEIGQLRNLTHLEITGTQITELPQEILELENLQTLILRGNQLQALPEDIGRLSRLINLDISSNPITEIPESIVNIYGLMMGCSSSGFCMGNLNIYNTGTQNEILLNQGLWAFYLSINPDFEAEYNHYQQTLSHGYRALLALIQEELDNPDGRLLLELGGTNGRIIPIEIGQLVNLEELTIVADNSPIVLPEELANLQNLRRLTIELQQDAFEANQDGAESAGFAELPTVIYSLSNLEVLIVRNSRLENLPEGISVLQNLRELRIEARLMANLPSDLGNLGSLVILEIRGDYVYGLALTSLPENIGSLGNLRELYLSYSQVSSLPESFGLLTKLQTLDLANNRLRSLPESFGQLSALQTLLLNNNQLRQMPRDLSALEAVTSLDLRSNSFDRFPVSVLGMPSLCTVDLRGNVINLLPLELGGYVAPSCENGTLRVNMDESSVILPSITVFNAMGLQLSAVQALVVLRFAMFAGVLALIMILVWALILRR